MKNPIAEALYEVLSVLSKESRAAVIFMLEDRCGVKMNESSSVTMSEVRNGLEYMFGGAAEILAYKIEEYMVQHPAVAPELNR